jgi:hypothetical protein
VMDDIFCHHRLRCDYGGSARAAVSAGGGLHSRVLAGNGHFLLALEVITGKPAPGFGNEGHVDLMRGVLGDLKDGRYG